MFTPEKTKIMNRISQLEDVAKSLLSQMYSLPKKHVLIGSYTLAISEILETIEVLSKELTIKESKEVVKAPEI